MSSSLMQTTKHKTESLHGLLACIAFSAMLALSAPSRSQEVAIPKAYEPYAFLIGEWEVGSEGGAPAAVTRFRWGPKQTYIWYSGGLLVNGKEQPGFEGLLVWNGVHHNLDMLLVLDLDTGGLVQEQGAVSVEADGSVVRDITVYYSEGNALPPDWKKAAGPTGAKAHFRQTFKLIGPGPGYGLPYCGRAMTVGYLPSRVATLSLW
jgi:hypothetical protein